MADKTINKKDILLIVSVLLIAILALGFSYFTRTTGTKVTITYDGEEYGTYDLQKDQIIYLEEGGGTNTVQIKAGSVSMIEASCPDQICVHSYPLSEAEPGMIVCLPHRIVVKVE